MSIPIITKRNHVELISYDLTFSYRGDPGCGYAFPCDENGVVEVGMMTPCAIENLEMCRSSPDKLIATGIRKSVNRYTEPATARCTCGGVVTLEDPMNNDCPKCHQTYNMSGQHVQSNYGRAECLADGCAWDEDDY